MCFSWMCQQLALLFCWSATISTVKHGSWQLVIHGYIFCDSMYLGETSYCHVDLRCRFFGLPEEWRNFCSTFFHHRLVKEILHCGISAALILRAQKIRPRGKGRLFAWVRCLRCEQPPKKTISFDVDAVTAKKWRALFFATCCHQKMGQIRCWELADPIRMAMGWRSGNSPLMGHHTWLQQGPAQRHPKTISLVANLIISSI